MYFKRKLGDDIEEWQKKLYENKIETCYKICEMLKSSCNKENILKQVKALVIEQKFPEKLDTVKHILGFNNGVYDFELGAFRDGRLEDYISQTVGYDYKEYDPEDENQQALDTYLAQMYVNPKVRQYVLDVIGVAACCGKIEQFNIFWGDSGANGKSTFMDLLLQTFGNYGKTMPIAFFTQKRASSNAAQPELERLKGSRLAVLSESNDDDIMNVGLIKEMSGHDRIIARGLFKDPIEFELYAQFVLCCNTFPKIPLGSANDGGTWRRLKVIEHSSYFYVDNPPANIRGKTFFKKDPNIGKKLKLFPPYLMSKIINNIQRQYPELEINIPKEVELATDNYQKENDMFRTFLEETLTMDNQRTMDKVNITELYSRFVRWLKVNSTLPVTITKPDILKKLEQNRLKISRDKRYVLNVSFKSEYEDDVSDDEGAEDQAPANLQNADDSDVIFSFKHWLKHTFIKNVEVSKSTSIDSRVPTEYIYEKFINYYARPMSVCDKNMIQDVMSHYFMTEHGVDKKVARNNISKNGMCFIGIKLIEAVAGPST
eukprot:761668-Hanusia_phi.AAC.1